ncbi:vomeronasal type-1 receptor 1-like [Dromiciops gliroides]|uniref:vomeronasal type-1 receptor 1-like n=1 Tax=Dromiciops gliroides TaxID=33562 RepID=UPI001CC66957|nr:vomeronasal type-1 receptor 1-like [Dromiciops gliroides]
MIPIDILLGIAFFSQTRIGIQGNLFLIYLFSFVLFTGERLRPIDLLLIHLALANSLVLLSKGFLQGLAALGLKNFLDDIGCKGVFYLHRVARGLSLSMTCLLSGVQAIIISPHKPGWIKLKARVPRSIIPAILLCWIFYMLQNISILDKLKGPRGSRNISERKDYGYCSVNVATKISASLHAAVFSLPDAVCMTLIGFTSGYKIFLLYKHHKRIQQVHTDRFSPRTFPEARATQMILLLVSTFVTFYLLNTFLIAYMHSITPTPWMMHSCTLLASCFPMLSPFVLIRSDSQILRYYSTIHGGKSPLAATNSNNIQSLISSQAQLKEKKSLEGLNLEVSKQIWNPHVAPISQKRDSWGTIKGTGNGIRA